MYSKMTEDEWVALINETESRKRDYIAPVSTMRVATDRPGETDLTVTLPDGPRTYRMGELAHRHMAADLGMPVYEGVPIRYYQRMRVATPDLFDETVNTWLKFTASRGQRHRMIRALDPTDTQPGLVRGICSDSYLTLDDKPTMDHLAASLAEIPDLFTASCDYSFDGGMHLKVISRQLQGEVTNGHPINFGVAIKNHPARESSLQVLPIIEEEICSNGLVIDLSHRYGLSAMTRVHRGPKIGRLDVACEYRTTWAQEESRRGIWSQANRTIRSIFKSDVFARFIESARAAAERPLVDPEHAVRVLRKNYDITEEAGEIVLRHLRESGEMHQWGLTRAVTRTAQDMPNYLAADQFERLGGFLVELTPAQWKQYAEAESGGAAVPVSA